MSGPIVRSGPNEKYASNWESAFGAKKSVASKPKATKKAPAKAATKATAKKKK